MRIRPETPEDEDAIRNVHRTAFGGIAEAALVDSLRAAGDILPGLSLVAEKEDLVVGHILFSPVALHCGDRPAPGAALAPLGVLPPHQRRGIGSALVREGLKRLAALGQELVLVVGEPSYYRRFGFSPDRARSIVCPFSGEHLLALELFPDGLPAGQSVRATYPPAFSRLA